MRLFDTATHGYVQLHTGPPFKMYVCGITPYDSAHLGHVFTFMIYDLLQRRLEDQGVTVQLVRNITDVDEPIYKRAAELGIEYNELAEREIDSFHRVMDQLNFRPLYAEPKASEYVAKIAIAVKQLLDAEVAYRLDSDIYFDVSKYPSFGSFSTFDDRLRLAFMADRGGDPKRPGKHSPFDFLLWRGVSNSADLASWDSVVGIGRPGWHIECSVMSSELLGLPFDLHGGGTDLIFPHHECEIAQSVGLGQANPARIWVHVSPLLFAGEKMSKSLGNLVFAKDLLKTYEPAVIRLALFRYHHRIGGEWQPELLAEAAKLLGSFRSALSTESVAIELLEAVRAALDDDLNTPAVNTALEQFVIRSRSHGLKSNSGIAPIMSQVQQLLGL